MWFHKKKGAEPHPALAGLISALAVAVYIILGISVAQTSFFASAMSTFQEQPFAPLFFLLILSMSALYCASVTLLYPVKLLLEKRFATAATVLGSTVAWMLLFVLIVLIVASKMGAGA